MLLEVSTSDESCFRVCVKLREASASARVSSTGRVSHVSHPTHPVTPQPGGTAGPLLALLLLLLGFSTLMAVGGVVAAAEAVGAAGWLDAAIEAALAAAANNEGDGARDGGGVASV